MDENIDLFLVMVPFSDKFSYGNFVLGGGLKRKSVHTSGPFPLTITTGNYFVHTQG